MRERDRAFDVRPLLADFRNAHGGATRRGITAAPLAFLPRVDGARIAPLNHEAGQRAMKVLSVVKPVSHELQDMGDGFRRLVRIGLEGERALRRLDDDDRAGLRDNRSSRCQQRDDDRHNNALHLGRVLLALVLTTPTRPHHRAMAHSPQRG